jgi:hypothetical protein
MKKHFALRFIQTAWVIEVIVLILYTMLVTPLLNLERLTAWNSTLMAWVTLIGSQGAAAGLGPLASDFIKHKRGTPGTSGAAVPHKELEAISEQD